MEKILVHSIIFLLFSPHLSLVEFEFAPKSVILKGETLPNMAKSVVGETQKYIIYICPFIYMVIL